MTQPLAFEPSLRPLTDTERRLIRAKCRNLAASASRVSRASLSIAVGLSFVLWLATILASDAPWLVVTAFWLVVGAGIALWVRLDLRRDGKHLEGIARDLESALRSDVAKVYDLRARSFVELEEIEDEGACYAFELEDARLVFIQGQEFYEGARFPSLDFSLVYILDETGRTVDMLIDKRGAKATPARRIPAAVKQGLDVPDHLEVRIGGIDDVEAILRMSSSD